MQTIWLQRSSPDIPWGFRLVGGREFGVPLSVQRVTPGSVAASALGPGDVILKVGNVMATNLEHNDAQELVRQATNILQLTIRKSAEPTTADLHSPAGPAYGNYTSAQINDNSGYGTTPRSFGAGIQLSPNYSRGNEATSYATTPRNYGSQHQQPLTATRIEIQRVNPAQQQSGYNNNYYHNDDNVDTGGSNFPDYTIAYRKQDPIHDSPGGPVNIRVYNPPSENTSYSSKSLPRDSAGYNNSDREGFGGVSGPPAYEPRAQNASQSSFSPRTSAEVRFNTGIPFQPNAQTAQQSFNETTPQSYQNSYNSVPAQPAYGYAPFSPSSSGPKSQQFDSSSTPAFSGREPAIPSASHFNQTPSYERDNNVYDQSNIRGSVGNTYSTQAYSKPPYVPHNEDFAAYNSAAQYHSPQKAYAPTQISTSSTFEAPSVFSPSQSKPYQSFITPGSSSGYPAAQPTNRRVSFDQNIHESEHYPQPSSFAARSFKSPPPTSNSTQEHHDYGVHDSGISSSSSGRFSRQSSRHDDPYAASPYTPQGGPLSPRSETAGYGYIGETEGYDPSGVSAAMEKINFSPRFEPPPPVAPAPPPPPPPPPPPGPPPPPAPPLNDWSSTPYKRQNYKQRDEPEEQKIPDQILNTMLKSAKGGGPKPFSYGIDLSELKKKIGPPTAPKPRPGQPNYEEDDDEQEMPRQYGGPPRKPAGYVQSDYFISRDDNPDQSYRGSRKPAGLVQADYYQSRQTGPRSEVDESPININMGTDPKKQSKSFKVLQWMTETDKEDPEGKKAAGAESGQKPKRSKDPQRRHNADDDEMRFSGLHSKADIPSKAFGILQRMSSTDSGAGTQNGKDTLDVGDADERVGNYDETSIRYKGKSIPSPSFRVLQSWAQNDPDPYPPAGVSKEEEDDDGLPDTLNSDDMVDRRYKGGNIPSKVFKVLQKSVGDDTPEAPSPPISRQSAGGQPKSVAPVSDF